ncbi:hypothetical protein IGI_05666 [Bacillus toyonensis]|nr:hypothetical protein IGI_05666 [Bacillus toyonensis]
MYIGEKGKKVIEINLKKIIDFITVVHIDYLINKKQSIKSNIKILNYSL